jgi:hypothetical protein
LAPLPDDFVFTRDFLCEPAGGRVFALLQPRIGRPVLEAVLECDDAELAQRAADVLADAARGKRDTDAAMELVLAELPAEAGVAFRDALDQVRAGREEADELFLDDDEDGPVVDFGALFPARDQDEWQLTPRTASILDAALSLLGDHAYDDIEVNGGAAVDGDEKWAVFCRLAPSTWQEDLDWRRRVARACDDLAGDIESGRLPVPRCDAEAVVMRLAIGEAQQWLTELDEDDLGGDDLDGEELAQESLPEHRDDYNWDGCAAVLLRGRGEPDVAWFEWFGDAEPRDPERGFRR